MVCIRVKGQMTVRFDKQRTMEITRRLVKENST